VARVVNVHAAKTGFSRLLARAHAGEEIIIARAGKPVARLVPLRSTSPKRRPGLLAGRVRMSDDFDAPLPADLAAAFDDAPIEPPSRPRRRSAKRK